MIIDSDLPYSDKVDKALFNVIIKNDNDLIILSEDTVMLLQTAPGNRKSINLVIVSPNLAILCCSWKMKLT